VTIAEPSRPAAPQEEITGEVVPAAGVVCWRSCGPARDDVEVLLVHRPRYDDWSFPKGKLEPDERLPLCALRELVEETGVRAVLGRPLPGQCYRQPDGSWKQVHYWAAAPVSAQRATAAASEVDQATWLSAAGARERLSYPADVELLEHVVELARHRELATTPVIVVRHATARPRESWPRADAERPLVTSGRRQAISLAELLECWRPQHLLSSPWQRCLDTLEPYATAARLKPRAKGGLSEGGHQRNPAKARSHTEGLLQRGQAGLLCTHRPVLRDVLAVLQRAAVPEVRDELPSADPWLDPGELLVAHATHRNGQEPRVIAVERHRSPR
jgi:8-oxo-(d)GTP phosphatase